MRMYGRFQGSAATRTKLRRSENVDCPENVPALVSGKDPLAVGKQELHWV